MLAVVRTGDTAYGLNVRRELETVTEREIAIGAVCATLDRLEAKGLVISSRPASDADAPSRRVFAVTSLGARSLAFTRAMRERLWLGAEVFWQLLLTDQRSNWYRTNDLIRTEGAGISGPFPAGALEIHRANQKPRQ
jgi:PadR family transcriptional regulator PadR